MKENLIVNFTPTGMIPTKDMTPHVPVSPCEIIDQVLELSEEGLITMVHIHARNSEGIPTLDPDVYAEIIAGIRRYNKELIICVSLSGRYEKDPDKRALPLILDGMLKPDMGSLTLSSLNFNKEASVNSPQTVKFLAEKMLDAGIKPELEVFDTGMINYAKYLDRKQLIKPPYYFNLILGNIACMQVDPLHIGLLIRDLPYWGNQMSYWSIGGIGDYQFNANMCSILFGRDESSGIRIGLEDNIYFNDNRTELATNAMLVRRIVDMANRCGRDVMSSQRLRSILHLKSGGEDGYGVAS